VLLSLLYLVIGDSSTYWGGVNIITQIGFIGYLSYLMESYQGNTENESLFFTYIKYLSIANCIYIAVCVFRDKNFVFYNTSLFAYIMGIGLVVFLIHCAKKK